MPSARPRRLGLAVLAILIVSLLSAGVSSAAITVSNTNDSGPGSLRQAIVDAPPGETIVVPAGTYTLTSGELLITKALTIEGHGAADTTIRSGGTSRVFLAGGEFDLTISRVTIRDGSVTGGVALGGGILALVSRLTVRDAVVTSNTARDDGASGEAGGTAEGGGMAVIGALDLIDSRVTDNLSSAVGGSGKAGGAAFGGGIVAVGPMAVSNSTISGNLTDARGGQGPANAEQDGGSAQAGGLLGSHGENESVRISNSTISGNTADASGGPGGTGGIAYAGGALEASGSSLEISGTTIALNAARALPTGGIGYGGGLFTSILSTQSVRLVGSTLAANRLEAPSPTEAFGGNILAAGPLTVGDTIVSDGVGPAGSENCLLTDSTSLGFNLDSLNQCKFTAPGDQVGKAPLLGPLQDNGGPTPSMLPEITSPAVDQGSALGLSTDQRGVLRPIDFPSIPNAAGGDGSDIGAAELQPSNDITLGKLKRNRKKGTATLTVFIPQPSAGLLQLGGKGLKPKSAAIAGQAKVKLKVAGKRRIRKALRKRGKRKVGLRVTYSPTGNTPETLTRKAKLVKKKRKKRHRRNAKR